MDLRKLKKLIDLVEESGIAELEVTEGEEKVRITRGLMSTQMQAIPQMMTVPAAPAAAAPTAAPVLPVATETNDLTNAVKSPMVGTFYSAPSPASPSFVEVGQTVNVGDTLCIIEAMKLMNEVQAEVEGTIVEVLIKNEEMAEYGQPLFKVKCK